MQKLFQFNKKLYSTRVFKPNGKYQMNVENVAFSFNNRFVASRSFLTTSENCHRCYCCRRRRRRSNAT